jgi:hypothetical protein
MTQTVKSLMSEKYIEALRLINDWATVSEWAVKVAEVFPEILN